MSFDFVTGFEEFPRMFWKSFLSAMMSIRLLLSRLAGGVETVLNCLIRLTILLGITIKNTRLLSGLLLLGEPSKLRIPRSKMSIGTYT